MMIALKWIGLSVAGLCALFVVLVLLSVPLGIGVGWSAGYAVGSVIRYGVPLALVAGLALLAFRHSVRSR